MSRSRGEAGPRSRVTVIGATLTAAAVVGVVLVVGARGLGAVGGGSSSELRNDIGSPVIVGLDERGAAMLIDSSARPSVSPTEARPLTAEQPALPEPMVTSAPPSPSGASAAPSSSGTRPVTVASNSGAEDQVLAIVNSERATAGCGALTIDSRLATAARNHSGDMAKRAFFAHDTPEGVTVGTRVTNAGYSWSMVGENIAMGQTDAKSVMRDWMNSSGHRANILNCKYRHIGVGLAYDGNRRPYWTQDFGAPR